MNTERLQTNVENEKIYTKHMRQVLHYQIKNETERHHNRDIFVNKTFNKLNDTIYDSYNNINMKLENNEKKQNQNLINVEDELKSLIRNETVRASNIESQVKNYVDNVNIRTKLVESNMQANVTHLENKLLGNIKTDLKIINSTINQILTKTC